MQATARAVERLTETHTELIDGAVGVSGPLLDVLRDARYPNLGRTRGGGGGGDMFDVAAVDLYEHIDGTVRAWLEFYRQDHTGDLVPLVVRLHETLNAEHAGGRLEEPERMFAMFESWVASIENHFDPPKEYELTAPCPECAAERVPTGSEPRSGEKDERPYKWAVRVPVKVGHAVVAECHACEALWAGRDRLTDLAERMGLDVDWVALRELVGDTKDSLVVAH